MSTEIQPPASNPFPRQCTDAYVEGQADAFDEPRWVIEQRIAQAYDYATANDDLQAQRWQAEYAAGAHATWRALDSLQADLDAFGVR